MAHIDYNYLDEKLTGAVETLVTDPSGIQERLRRAVEHMFTLQFDGSDEAVPANMAPRLQGVRRMVEDGCDDSEAQRAARELLDVFVELRVMLEKPSSAASLRLVR